MTGERDEGQAAVELALVLPLLVALLLAVVQVVLVARDQILVVHAARAGARQAAVDPDAARRAVLDAAGGGLEAGRLVVELTPAGGRGPLVTATVRYRSPTDVPLVGPLLPDVPLSASATMATELSVPSYSTGQ